MSSCGNPRPAHPFPFVPADAKITANPMIAHTLALDDINKGFNMMHAGQSIRSVVVYWGDRK